MCMKVLKKCFKEKKWCFSTKFNIKQGGNDEKNNQKNTQKDF